MVGIVQHVGEKGREYARTRSGLGRTKGSIVPVRLLVVVPPVNCNLARRRWFTPGIQVGLQIEIAPAIVGVGAPHGLGLPLGRSRCMWRRFYNLLRLAVCFRMSKCLGRDVGGVGRAVLLGRTGSIEIGGGNSLLFCRRPGWRLWPVVCIRCASSQPRSIWRVLGHRRGCLDWDRAEMRMRMRGCGRRFR